MMLRREALDAVRFAQADLDSLVAAIEVNDRIDPDAQLTDRLAFDNRAERFIQGFCLSRQLWREGFDPPALIAMAASLRRGGELNKDERRWFKQVRARFKHLRFAFFLYSAGHRSPPMLSLITLVMGELQDATRVRGPREISRHAARLQLLLAGPGRLLLAREVDRLVPSDAAGFRQFTLSQVESLRSLLRAPMIGAHAFHTARKVVSRQVSFHDDMRVLHPSAQHEAMARWLATLNGLMGQYHDDLVARDAAGAFRYRRDTFALPVEVRVRLEALVGLYRGTSSSEPPAT